MAVLRELWAARGAFVFLLLCALVAVVLTWFKQWAESKLVRRRVSRRPLSTTERMSGREFEIYLDALFKKLGYVVELTPQTGDFGADHILVDPRTGKRVAVQAKKRQKGKVGLDAIQEAHFARARYRCHEAWVVTNVSFTPAAIQGAEETGVRLFGREDLEKSVRLVGGKI